MSFSCMLIVLQIELISIRNVVYEDLFLNKGKKKLGNGLLTLVAEINAGLLCILKISCSEYKQPKFEM